MFLAHGKDGLVQADADSEKVHLLSPNPPLVKAKSKKSGLMKGEIKVTKLQAVAGILLGLVIFTMLVLLVLEGIREEKHPLPFLDGEILKESDLFNLRHEQYGAARTEGEDLVEYRKNLERMLYENGIFPKKGSSSSLLQRFQRANVNVDPMSDCAIIVENMKRRLGGCIDPALLPDICIPRTPNECDDSSPFRSFNGSCNNLEYAEWGAALTSFRRMLPPAYADGVSTPRISLTGDELPCARHLSNELYTHPTRPRCNCTVLTLYFGLFIDHDIVRIASKSGHKGAPISCCDPKVLNNPALLHPECMAIGIPRDDPFYGPLDVTCQDFVRSAAVLGECAGEREQMNLVSSFLDASGVYGSSEEDCRSLRYFKRGLLRVCWINDTEMLPQGHHLSYDCGFPDKSLFCFKAGDMRVNEQVELTALHTMWMREHNRIATRLYSLNPQWDDERLFQESRRLVIAELQHVVFHEFLPVLLGEEVAKRHNLTTDGDDTYEGYDPSANPSIYNVFGAAAFRVGHSLIEATIDLIGPKYSTEREIPLHTAFLNPHLFYEKGMDSLLRGLVREKARSVDSFITDEVRNRLFQPHNGRYGQDLSAIGIQRGRDHGIPGYVEWRRYCGLGEITQWEDFLQAMDSQHVDRLRRAYGRVEDVDLIPAALSERHLPGALVGPLHACLIARQFHQLRISDRFWFEVQDQPGSFQPDQLNEIYKSSLARLLCDNSDSIQEIQRFPIRSVSPENPVVKCSDLLEVDLKAWAEE